MKETGHVVNPEASPSPLREVGEAEPLHVLMFAWRIHSRAAMALGRFVVRVCPSFRYR